MMEIKYQGFGDLVGNKNYLLHDRTGKIVEINLDNTVAVTKLSFIENYFFDKIFIRLSKQIQEQYDKKI